MFYSVHLSSFIIIYHSVNLISSFILVSIFLLLLIFFLLLFISLLMYHLPYLFHLLYLLRFCFLLGVFLFLLNYLVSTMFISFAYFIFFLHRSLLRLISLFSPFPSGPFSKFFHLSFFPVHILFSTTLFISFSSLVSWGAILEIVRNSSHENLQKFPMGNLSPTFRF